MTQDEIIIELISKGIVAQIGDVYLITEKYKELLQGTGVNLQKIEPIKIDYDKLLNKNLNASAWPKEVIESAGRFRVLAFLDVCRVPHACEAGNYRLRAISDEVIAIFNNIIVDESINPVEFIKAITLYYKSVERPRSFKNLITSGDALDIYQEYINGQLTAFVEQQKTDGGATWG